MLTHGSLFSGIGGFDLGFERAGFTTLWQVECDPYCLKVLEKHWPDVTRYADVRSVHGVLAHAEHDGLSAATVTRSSQTPSHWSAEGTQQASESPGSGQSRGGAGVCGQCLAPVDLITGGFPCQPFSVAGKRRGTSDDRFLWPEMRRVIEEVRPRWVVAENVPGIIKMALDQVLSDLEALGYTVGAVTIPACAVDAPHRRERLWIVAFANAIRRDGRQNHERHASPGRGWIEQGRQADVADCEQPKRRGCARTGRWIREHKETPGNGGRRTRQANGLWFPEPAVGRVAHGVPHRVDRLRSLGNAIVPQIAEELAWMIRGVEECSATGSGGF